MTAAEIRQRYAAVFEHPIELAFGYDDAGRALKPREFRKLEDQWRESEQ